MTVVQPQSVSHPYRCRRPRRVATGGGGAGSGAKTANVTNDADGTKTGNDGFGDPSKALAITYNAQHQTAGVTNTQQHVIPMDYTGAGQAEQDTKGI